MWGSTGSQADDERLFRRRILAFVDEHCAGMTLADAGEWYNDAFVNDAAGEPYAEDGFLNRS